MDSASEELPGNPPPVLSSSVSLEDMSYQEISTEHVIHWPGLLLRTSHVTAPEIDSFIPALPKTPLLSGWVDNQCEGEPSSPVTTTICWN